MCFLRLAEIGFIGELMLLGVVEICEFVYLREWKLLLFFRKLICWFGTESFESFAWRNKEIGLHLTPPKRADNIFVLYQERSNNREKMRQQDAKYK